MPAREPSPQRDAASSRSPLDVRDPRVAAAIDRYWRKNVALMAILLLVWALVGLGCGVVFADRLNAFEIGGFPLGFWFAQQGSIAVFVVLIWIYAVVLHRFDRAHHAELESIREREDTEGRR